MGSGVVAGVEGAVGRAVAKPGLGQHTCAKNTLLQNWAYQFICIRP